MKFVPHSRQTWTTRYALLLVGLAPVAAQLIGSAFNIGYNIVHVNHLLIGDQPRIFNAAIFSYNAVLYPIAAGIWIRCVFGVRRAYHALLRAEPVEPKRLQIARRRSINLPWYALAIALFAWLSCIPVFLGALSLSQAPVDALVYVHLPISLLISAMIAVTHGFFLVELSTQRWLYPVLFRDAHPVEVPGAYPLTLRGRGFLCAISAGVCPVASLLLLLLAPHPPGWRTNLFAIAVAVVAASFALTLGWLMSRLVVDPIHALRIAAGRVTAGDLDARLDLQRADEFGLLIDGFNEMVAELREKRRLRETFGMHVGQEAAEQILQRDPGLGGLEHNVTVLFADIRGFTARCAACPARDVVETLNVFFSEMVDIVESRCGGMINKFLGDGFMAVFGAGDNHARHADAAVQAAREMISSLDRINDQLQAQGRAPLSIGVGIHSGPAVVGVVGSPQRQEFTVIGDTVNIASRVEALTKTLSVGVLFTDSTLRSLQSPVPLRPLQPQMIRGKSEPIAVFTLIAPALPPMEPSPDSDRDAAHGKSLFPARTSYPPPLP